MMIYNTGTLHGLIEELDEMKAYLGEDETELVRMTHRIQEKLRGMTEDDFIALDLNPYETERW